jgi:hypothetical protein
MTDRETPPAEWWDAYECPREDCEARRYTNLGMDYHLLREHDVPEIGEVPPA